MMEVERLKALQDYEEREQQAYLQQLRGAKVLKYYTSAIIL